MIYCLETSGFGAARGLGFPKASHGLKRHAPEYRHCRTYFDKYLIGGGTGGKSRDSPSILNVESIQPSIKGASLY